MKKIFIFIRSINKNNLINWAYNLLIKKMADIIGRLKEKLNDSSTSTIPEIQFLAKSDLNSALNRGFIELYHTRFIELYHFQPKNPILFLSKFLQKEIKNKRIKKKSKTRRPFQRKIREDFNRKREEKRGRN